MKPRTEHFPSWIKKYSPNIFLVSGDDVYLSEDCLQQLTAQAQQRLSVPIATVTIAHKSDWQTLGLSLASQSLLQPQKIIVCRFKGSTLDNATDAWLHTQCQQLVPNTCLYLACGKLTPAQKKRKTIQMLEQQHRHLAIWPLQPKQCATWMQQRSQSNHIQLTSDQGIKLLHACHHEPSLVGNALDILALTYQNQTIPTNALEASWGNASTKTVFDILDHCLRGEQLTCANALDQYQQHHHAPISMLYVIHKMLTDIDAIHRLIDDNKSTTQAVKAIIKWPSKQPLYQAAAQRLSPKKIRMYLYYLAQIEQTTKGILPGKPWHQIKHLLLDIAQKAPHSTLHYGFLPPKN